MRSEVNTDHDASKGDDERQCVSAKRLFIFPVSLGENVNEREKPVATQRLEHFWGRNEAGKCRAESGREATRVVQRAESGDERHHLVAVVQTPFARGVALAKLHELCHRPVDVIVGVASGIPQHGRTGDDREYDVRQ